MIRMGCQVELPCTAEEYFAVCLKDESQFMQMYCDNRKDSELQVLCFAFMVQELPVTLSLLWSRKKNL